MQNGYSLVEVFKMQWSEETEEEEEEEEEELILFGITKEIQYNDLDVWLQSTLDTLAFENVDDHQSIL